MGVHGAILISLDGERGYATTRAMLLCSPSQLSHAGHEWKMRHGESITNEQTPWHAKGVGLLAWVCGALHLYHRFSYLEYQSPLHDELGFGYRCKPLLHRSLLCTWRCYSSFYCIRVQQLLSFSLYPTKRHNNKESPVVFQGKHAACAVSRSATQRNW